MYYLIYKIKNLINGKVYVGAHKTKILKDGYMGSGLLIKRAIKKYGINNFKKKILKISHNEKAMYELEAAIVNDAFINQNQSYNIAKGGKGGWEFVNNKIWTKEKRIKHGLLYGSRAGSWQCLEKRRKIWKCVSLEKRIKIGKNMGLKFGGLNRLPKDIIHNRLNKLKSIDLTKLGWVNKVAKRLFLTHTQVRRFMKKNYHGKYFIRRTNSLNQISEQ